MIEKINSNDKRIDFRVQLVGQHELLKRQTLPTEMTCQTSALQEIMNDSFMAITSHELSQ